MNKKQKAGKIGGIATLKKYGKEHYQRIGKIGGIKFHSLYRLVPVNRNQFAIVRRSNGEFVRFRN